MNMQMIMQQAKKMQTQLLKEQEELNKTEYEGSSSLVNIKINGKFDVLSVKINIADGDNIEADDVEMLEDLILTAFKEGVQKADSITEAEMSKYNIPGGMGGLF